MYKVFTFFVEVPGNFNGKCINIFYTFLVFSCDEKCINTSASKGSFELGISSFVLLICRSDYCIARLPSSINIFKHGL